MLNKYRNIVNTNDTSTWKCIFFTLFSIMFHYLTQDQYLILVRYNTPIRVCSCTLTALEIRLMYIFILRMRPINSTFFLRNFVTWVQNREQVKSYRWLDVLKLDPSMHWHTSAVECAVHKRWRSSNSSWHIFPIHNTCAQNRIKHMDRVLGKLLWRLFDREITYSIILIIVY